LKMKHNNPSTSYSVLHFLFFNYERYPPTSKFESVGQEVGVLV
jgi:hypothetical protein